MTDQKKKTVLFSVLAVICAVASLALIVFSMLTPGIFRSGWLPE